MRRASIWLREIEEDRSWTKLPCPFNLLEFIVVAMVYISKRILKEQDRPLSIQDLQERYFSSVAGCLEDDYK